MEYIYFSNRVRYVGFNELLSVTNWHEIVHIIGKSFVYGKHLTGNFRT